MIVQTRKTASRLPKNAHLLRLLRAGAKSKTGSGAWQPRGSLACRMAYTSSGDREFASSFALLATFLTISCALHLDVFFQPASKPVFQQASRSSAGRRLAYWIGISVLVLALSCGVKAPPMPRERVVPAPVQDVAVDTTQEGIQVTFTLPAKSLDGSPLEEIGGYRILREGPDGKDVREEVWLSISEGRQRPGKPVVFPDERPKKAGSYRYCVVPFDFYGSHPSERQVGEFCWEGFLPERTGESLEEDRLPKQ